MFTRSATLCVLVLTFVGCAQSQRIKRDVDIEQMVQRVSPSNIESDIKTLAAFGTRNTMSETESEERGIGAARRWIRDRFQEISDSCGGRLQVRMDRYQHGPDGRRIVKPTEIVNVVATLPGVQPESADRVYIVSGHYDSICSDPKDFECDAPGANDDASGVAAVLEAARVMSAFEFDATIVFMAVAGEEQGLIGSTYSAKDAVESGTNLAAMLTNDIIGGVFGVVEGQDTGRVRVFSEGVPMGETEGGKRMRLRAGGENDSPSRQLARYVATAADTYVRGFDAMLVFRLDRLMRGGDHKPFNDRGFAAVRFTEVYEHYDHQHQNVRVEDGIQYGDLPQFVNYDYVANVTRVNVAALASLARAPSRPKNVRIVADKLGPTTTLRWDANVEPDVTGYVILWRETTAAEWQYSQQVGVATKHTLDVSKDNYFFGVCSLDCRGHRSEAVFPIPSRD
jgi:peptidase M28-like protein